MIFFIIRKVVENLPNLTMNIGIDILVLRANNV
jgi:hypothetical protein